ncbi:MAG: PAS domain S-box protein [Desulfobacter sp.]|nr:MAG: PAS domain S-box protein [Desulfobacter sp.]
MPNQPRISLLTLLLPVFFWVSSPGALWAKFSPLKVGVFQNKPIVYYDTSPKGLFVEVMDYAAQKEGLDITYVTCEFKQCLAMLKSGELDLMPSLGHGPGRMKSFIYSREPVWTFWGTVYANDQGINTIFDLKGKIVGGRRKNRITAGLKDLTEKFKIPVVFVEFDNYEEAFTALKKNSLDAVAANNSYTFTQIEGKTQFHKTGIVFDPFSAYFAAPRNGGDPGLLDKIDRHVRQLREQPVSLFTRFNDRWFGAVNPFWTTPRVLGTIGGSALLMILAMTAWRFITMARVNSRLRSIITKQKNTEARLKSSQRRFRNIFENPHSVMLIIEWGSGDIIDANPAAAQFYGWTREELRKMNINRINTLDREEIRRTMYEAKAQERNFFSFRHRLKNGSVRDVEVHSGPIEVDGRRVLFSIIHDVSDRQRMAKRLKESDARMIPLFQKAADAIFVSRMDGRLIQVNEQACRATGYSESELLAMNVTQVDFNHNHPDRLREFVSGIELGKMVILESEHVRKDGSVFPVEITINMLDIPGGPFVMGIARDITARKTAEAEIREMEARIRQSRKMESIGSLAGGIAHDFNNLLFPIVGRAEMLMDDLPAGSQERESAREILSAGMRARDLVRRILSFSRQDDFRVKVIDFRLVLEEVLSLVRSTLPADIDLREDISSGAFRVASDPSRLHQVAMNLVTNAIHAIDKDGGLIKVALGRPAPGLVPETGRIQGEVVAFRVSDNGRGIPPDMMDKIFDPYFSTRERGRGTGLGLSVVYGIVRDLNGDIKVRSQVEKGSEFTVYLPLAGENGIREGRQTGPRPGGGMERILLVDDEPSIAALEAQVLERLGYRVAAETDSRAALAAFEKDPQGYDLLITDMTMPGLTGGRLARSVMEIRTGMPVIICTGFSEKLSRDAAEKMGVKAYLMKPVIGSELAQAVRRVLDGI